jgi:hypothetical protein
MDSSVGTIRVADRDTIIERYKEGVGVSIKIWVQSAMHDGVTKHWWPLQLPEYVSSAVAGD